MKALFALLLLILTFNSFADTYVKPYIRKDGAYVEGHYRSNPNNYRYDNYSSQGNSNPYTGQQGSGRNEYSTPPAYNQPDPYRSYRNPYDND